MVPLDWDAIHGKNVVIKPMGEVPKDQPQAIELLRRGVIDPAKFITHTFARDRVPEAFRLIEEKRDEVVKVVIEVKK